MSPGECLNYVYRLCFLLLTYASLIVNITPGHQFVRLQVFLTYQHIFFVIRLQKPSVLEAWTREKSLSFPEHNFPSNFVVTFSIQVDLGQTKPCSLIPEIKCITLEVKNINLKTKGGQRC